MEGGADQIGGLLGDRDRRGIAVAIDQVFERTPAGRWGAPDDFAGIAVYLASRYLASRASDFMTGAIIVLDGGYTIKI